MEIEPNITKLLPYMAMTHNNDLNIDKVSKSHTLMAMIFNSEIQNFKQLKQILCELWVPEVVDFRKRRKLILSLISAQKTQWFRI